MKYQSRIKFTCLAIALPYMTPLTPCATNQIAQVFPIWRTQIPGHMAITSDIMPAMSHYSQQFCYRPVNTDPLRYLVLDNA